MTLKNDNQLAGEWENFERNVVPVDAGAAQRLQMRVAFYAGAASLMKVLQVIDDSLPTTLASRYWSLSTASSASSPSTCRKGDTDGYHR